MINVSDDPARMSFDRTLRLGNVLVRLYPEDDRSFTPHHQLDAVLTDPDRQFNSATINHELLVDTRSLKSNIVNERDSIDTQPTCSVSMC